jgi:manganese/zinc/iron transport system substrate-binding protein
MRFSPSLNEYILTFSKKVTSIFLIALIFAISSCQDRSSSVEDTLQAKDEKGTIVSTTGIIADLVGNLYGDYFHNLSLMGAGVDPHLYRATQDDLRKLRGADLVLYNGLQLEGRLSNILEELGKRQAVYAVSSVIPKDQLRAAPEFNKLYDPHIWFEVMLWKRVAEGIIVEVEGRFKEAKANLQYLTKLDELDHEIREQIALIPKEQRVLITAHDAFGYYGRAYGIEVKGLQGLSTASELGLRDISDLSNFIVSRKIPAVFIESSVPEKLLMALIEGVKARGHPLKLGGTLYSDALGDSGTAADTYIGMQRHNLKTIVEALSTQDHGNASSGSAEL